MKLDTPLAGLSLRFLTGFLALLIKPFGGVVGDKEAILFLLNNAINF
jgi:hypothetical protein